MSLPRIVIREEWLAARKELLAEEKHHAMVSRAPLPKLERWKATKGWDIPWYSSFGTDFNYDYFLDLTPLGRQEEWEEPKGRSESARSARPDFAS